MRTRRILVLVAVLTAGLLGSSPALAGGWAETVLDPAPARIERGTTYTFGFWVLQHGSYPSRGDLGEVALIATGPDGKMVRFPATRSRTAGHYSAEVVFPRDGVWRVGAAHEGLGADTDVAQVTVPGAVRISPSDLTTRAPHDWGEFAPSFPPTAGDAARSAPQPVQPAAAPRNTAADPARTATAEPAGLPVELVGATGLVVLVLAVWLGRRHRRGLG